MKPALFFTVIPTVLALPSPADAPKQTTHLYICQDAGWKGTCTNLEATLGRCYNVPDDFTKKISSAGPDKGTFCAVYPENECSGKAFPFIHPGIWDMKNYNFSDVMTSYRCDLLAGFD